MVITDPEIIKTMLENDGTWSSGPKMAIIYSYLGMNELPQFACFLDYAYDDMLESPYIRKPVVLWTCDHGLTEVGKKWLEEVQ